MILFIMHIIVRQKYEINHFIQANEAYTDGRYEEGRKLAKAAAAISVIGIVLGLVVIAAVVLPIFIIKLQSKLLVSTLIHDS